ncbi:MAG: hypothetical protein FWC91_09870 [Defluviitaleaceae bacterium]|nr:hypothetical protein [Defluviitaleaceae bacterium]
MSKSNLKNIVNKILKFVIPTKTRKFLRQNRLLQTIHCNIIKRQTIKLIPNLKSLDVNNSQYIVSLTSYGRRLTSTAPYAIVSLLNQRLKPDKVILWVGIEEKNKLPKIMEKLISKGLEINFCEDIRSYTKLIPSLEKYPDNYIITADDDVYYPEKWFEELITEHRKSPNKIICHRAHGIKVDEDFNPLPYVQWDWRIDPNIYFMEGIFPTGVNGILYPPKCFHKDITNRELFMNLSPYADDIWFWAMAVINKDFFGDESPYIVVKNSTSRKLLGIDPEQKKWGNALWNYNSQGGNDKQLTAIIEKYPQIRDVLKKIQPCINQ